MIEIDARGFGCPIPVIKTKQAMENNPQETITIVVDSDAAKENVSRLARSRKYSMKLEAKAEEEYRLILTPSA